MTDKTKEIQKKETAQADKIERARAVRVFNPDVDIIERKDSIIVLADMPGVDENSVDVTLENDVLSIYGKVDGEVHEKLRLIHGEYGIGDYQRIFTLFGDISREKIQATVKNGVLRVTLPKAEATATRKILVKAGS